MGEQINSQQSALMKMIISMAIFGSIGFFSKRTGIPALELVFIRCFISTLFLGALWIITGGAKREVWYKREIIQILICGVFLVLNWLYLFKTIEASNVTIAISIYHLSPILVLLLGAIIYRERLTLTTLIAITLCFGGVLLIAQINEIDDMSALFSDAIIWGLLSALFYALLTLTGKGITKTSPYATTVIQVALGTLLLLPFVNFGYFNGLTQLNWIYIIVTGFLHTGIVFYLFFSSIRVLSTNLIAILVFIDPAVAIFMDVFIDHVDASLWQWIGVALIFVGMALTIRFKSKKPAIAIVERES